MNFLNKLERKYGRFGIPNLTTYIIICYAVGYLLSILMPQALGFLTLEPYFVFKGQIWRLFTWLLVPPSSFDIFTLIMLFFYYSLGNSLERNWGSFRYTVYIFSGFLFTIAGALILYFVTGAVGIGGFFSTYYVSMSIFLAFAASYPNMQVLLYFVFPIKIKWLAYLDIALLLVSIYQYASVGIWPPIVAIVASLLNFVLFFFASRNMSHLRPKEVKRRQEFKKAVNTTRVRNGVTKHRCAICGQTEEDNPDLEFRFCSKCNGNYEYCNQHLFTHKHIQ